MTQLLTWVGHWLAVNGAILFGMFCYAAISAGVQKRREPPVMTEQERRAAWDRFIAEAHRRATAAQVEKIKNARRN